MHKGCPLHKVFILLPCLERLKRLFHMINVEHHEAIQMAVSQTTMAKRIAFGCFCCVKLIAAEYECHKIVLQFLGKGQQTFLIALVEKILPGRSLLQGTLLCKELSIVRTVQPSFYAFFIMTCHHVEYVTP